MDKIKKLRENAKTQLLQLQGYIAACNDIEEALLGKEEKEEESTESEGTKEPKCEGLQFYT